ncbi:MAG: hypothetical protein JWP95_1691 [Actinotalea sp.]|nr:hypothetical protein [Actinotalea sp.]
MTAPGVGLDAPPVPPTQPHQRGAEGAGVVTYGGTVLGDGTTARSRARSRWRAVRWPLAVLLVIGLMTLVSALIRPETSQTPLAPDNPAEGGARALAEILTERGVTVHLVERSADALALAEDDTTLLVVNTFLLTDDQVDDLEATEADLVLAQPESWHLGLLSDEKMDTGSSFGEPTTAEAACEDPDARAAEEIVSNGFGLRADDERVTVCFPADPVDTRAGAYLVLQDGSRTVTAFDDASLMSNERLDEDGNAALMLRTLGEHDTLVWYIPSFTDTGEPTEAGTGSLLPSWTGPLAVQLLVTVLALALWRGRALGRIVSEPLPVTVRAAETTLGRGRLYRRSRSRGHAAAALRAGMARRAAARIGLPRTAGATDVIDALARATGRSSQQVADLLYGPPPTDDAALLQLARQLDELESEVHRT